MKEEEDESRREEISHVGGGRAPLHLNIGGRREYNAVGRTVVDGNRVDKPSAVGCPRKKRDSSNVGASRRITLSRRLKLFPFGVIATVS